LLIVEAAEHSGTSHTAAFAMEQGVNVMAVPGNIFSETSKGTNDLLKQGAAPVTGLDDIFHVLGRPSPSELSRTTRVMGETAEEQRIIDLLEQGVHEGSRLLAESGLPIDRFNYNLTMMEIRAKVRPLGGNQWALA
jgi:DNA processing protein